MTSPFRPRHFLPGILNADVPMGTPFVVSPLATPGNGPIAGYTNVFDFNLVNFDWVTWHNYEWQNWVQVDALLNTAIGFLNIRGIWRPLTPYTVGEGVYDPEDVSKLYRSQDDHTSTTDFQADILAGHWTQVTSLGPPVESVFGRLGDVVAQASDYAAFYYNKTEADARFINTAGDTMTGPLVLSGAPTANLHPTTKQYVDTKNTSQDGLISANASAAAAANANANTRVLKAGDTMTGFLTLHADPTAAMHAANKRYVDNVAGASGGPFLPLTGGTVTGTVLFSSGTPTIRFTETDAPSPRGQFQLSGAATGNFSLQRATAANYGGMTNVWRYDYATDVFNVTPAAVFDGTITCDGGSGWGLKIVSGYPSIWFHDDNVGGAYEHFVMSAGNGWMRFGVADSSGALTEEMFTLNPTSNATRSLLPFYGVYTGTDKGNITVESASPDIRFNETGQPAGKGFYRFAADAANFYFQSATEIAFTNRTTIWRYNDAASVFDLYASFNCTVDAQIGNFGISTHSEDSYIQNLSNSYIGFTVNAVTANSAVAYYFRDKNSLTMAAVYGPGTSSPNAVAVITREKGDLRYAAASSRRYKESIADIDEQELVDAFDRLVLKQWTWGGEVPVGDERHGTRGVGVIAEDLVQIFAPAVRSRWVQPPEPQPTEDGTEPPEVVATEKIPDATDPNALIAVLAAKIRWLERRLATLEAVQ